MPKFTANLTPRQAREYRNLDNAGKRRFRADYKSRGSSPTRAEISSASFRTPAGKLTLSSYSTKGE